MATLIVGISDMKIAQPPDTLITYALGSCVGICLLDPVARVGGMVHILLPQKAPALQDANPCKFADTAIPHMISRMKLQGAVPGRLVAKIAGGAQMFGSQAGSGSSLWQIGQRNVAATEQVLQTQGIQILARDVLKNYGRTVTFDPATGVMNVRAVDGKSVNM